MVKTRIELWDSTKQLALQAMAEGLTLTTYVNMALAEKAAQDIKNKLVFMPPIKAPKNLYKDCKHDFGDTILTSNPPKVKCIKCGFTTEA